MEPAAKYFRYVQPVNGKRREAQSTRGQINSKTLLALTAYQRANHPRLNQQR